MKSPKICDFVKGNTLTNINDPIQMSDICFSEFNLEKLVKNPAIMIIGKRECGKSWLILNIMHHMFSAGKINNLFVFSKTEKMNKFYSHYTTDIYQEYSSNVIKKILNKQEENNNSKCMVIFDDCIMLNNVSKCHKFADLIYNGRNYNITVVVSVQFPMGFSPEVRNNFDHIFLFDDDVISNIKRMYDHYAGIFPTFASFQQIFKQITGNFSSMVISQINAKNITDKIHSHKAIEINDKFNIPNILLKEELDEIKETEKKPEKIKKQKYKKIYTDFDYQKLEMLSDDSSSYDFDSSNNKINKCGKYKTNNIYDVNNKYDTNIYDLDNDTIFDAIPDVQNHKNKYDVLFEIVSCNNAIVNKCGDKLPIKMIKDIIIANKEIGKTCGMQCSLSI